MTDPADLTATEAARLMRSGRLGWGDVLEACLARIGAREPTVRAFATLDADGAREARRAAPDGVLRGLPVGVKDVLDTSDIASEYGSPIWAGHRPAADAASVAWTRAAGGLVIGKTVTTEFATRQPGPTTNPHDPTRTPGGSSSGSAAGVAAGFFPFAFGTQTAGSIIRPAAYCGVVGYKPSYGTIPRLGMKVMSDSLDTIGVMARSVADCALLAGAAGRRDLGNPDRKPERAPRVGLCRSAAWPQAAPETVAMFERVSEHVTRAGADASPFELPAAFEMLVKAHPVVMNGESARNLGWEWAHARDRLSDGLRERMEWGLAQPEADLVAALATFASRQAAFAPALGNLDILLTPSAPGEAPPGIGWTGDPMFNSVWTALHVPCVTVPAGVGPNGMPLGIQIVGRRGDDRAVLAWAQWVAAAMG